MPGAWQGSHWSANFQVTGMIRPGNIPLQAGFEPQIFRSGGRCLIHRPTRQCISGMALLRRLYMLPNRVLGCRSNLPSHPVTIPPPQFLAPPQAEQNQSASMLTGALLTTILGRQRRYWAECSWAYLSPTIQCSVGINHCLPWPSFPSATTLILSKDWNGMCQLPSQWFIP